MDSDNLPWPTIALFGTLAFIILAGFLTWLGGRIYVAIFGMPELNLEAIQGPNRRVRPARSRDPNEVTFSRLIAELCGRGLIERNEREIQEVLKQRAITREENILRSLGVGLDCPTLSDAETCKEETVRLAEDLKPPEKDCLVGASEPGSSSMNSDEVGDSELGDSELLDCTSLPRPTSLFEDIDDFIISDKSKLPGKDCLVKESEPGSSSTNSDELELGDWELLDYNSPPRPTSLFEDIDDFIISDKSKLPGKDCLVKESEPGSSSTNSNELELGDWELLDYNSPPRPTSLFEDMDDFIISDKVSDEFERPELEGMSSEYGQLGEDKLSPPLINNSGDVNDSQRVLQTILHFAQLPFFYVSNLACELKSESNAIRKYFMKVLPFYGVANLEEAQMASWETTRWLLSQLPFFSVSNEESVPECACLSMTEAGSDVEAGLSNSEELALSPVREMDFVHYEDDRKD